MSDPEFSSAERYRRGAPSSGPKFGAKFGARSGALIIVAAAPLCVGAVLEILALNGIGAALNAALFAGYVWAARRMGAGLAFEARYNRRAKARGARAPNKALAAAAVGVLTALTAWLSAGVELLSAAALGALAGAACAVLYGLDPVADKGEFTLADVDDRAAEAALRDARACVRDLRASIATLRDAVLRDRGADASAAADAVLQTIADDPADLRRARKTLRVYLPSLRDAARKYALAAETGLADSEAYLKFRTLLGDAATAFKQQTAALKRDNQIDLDVELDVLGRRLAAETNALHSADPATPLSDAGDDLMSAETIREKAAAAVADAAEVLDATLPPMKGEVVTIDAAEPDLAAQIQARMDEIEISSTQSIIKFGSQAQEELTAISDEMLAGVRNKDVGPAGASLRQMVGAIRGFDVDALKDGGKEGFLARVWVWITGRSADVHDYITQFEEVRGQIDGVTDDLLGHETKLLKDIRFLDKLYETSLDFYDELAVYIAAGEAKLAQLDDEIIPAKEAETRNAEATQGVIKAQELRDLRAARDDLERRVHDLKLTRQVTMQSLPSIRLVQENDKSLVNKINSTIVNTVPLWQTQLAQAVTIQRSREAARTVKDATDLTNDLLTKNADNLQDANREVREQMERGVFDIESVKHANQRLIDTIEESLAIADEGKRRREAAEADLQRMETELKQTLAAASARRPAVEAAAGAPDAAAPAS